jgi:AcrR family transcriptional regulator
VASVVLTDAKRRLLDGARRLFAQQGYSNTSIRDIAKACGINSATLYSHVPSKADLYIEIVDPYLDAAQAAFSAAARTGGDGATRLEAMIDATIEVQRTYRDEYLSLLRDWHNMCRVPELAHLRERRRKGSELWLQVIKSGIEDRSLRADVRPGEIQWLVANLVASVFDDRFEGAAEAPTEAQRRASLRVLLDGLRASWRERAIASDDATTASRWR